MAFVLQHRTSSSPNTYDLTSANSAMEDPSSVQHGHACPKRNPFRLLGILPTIYYHGNDFIDLLNDAQDHVKCATAAGHPGPFPQYDEMTAAANYLKAVFERNDRDEVLELIYWTENEVPTFYFNSMLPFGHPNVLSPTEAGVRLRPKLRAAPPNLVGLGQDNEAQPRMTFPPPEDR
ncbi:hypothetical protein VE03_10652, partial [Pseudogymnoascus sp. 23342-1-I1]